MVCYGKIKENEVVSVLGPRIAVLRKEAGLSQAELAQQLNVSPSAVGMYEQGRREPPARMLVALAEVFGVSTDYLLTGRPQSPVEGQTLSRILLSRLDAAQARLEERADRPFSRQELAVLFAAMLTEP